MSAKKSNPDAKARSIVPLSQAVNGSGQKSLEQCEVTRLHEAVNRGGGKEGYKPSSKNYDVKTTVDIPSVGAQKSIIKKQMSTAEKNSKKKRGY